MSVPSSFSSTASTGQTTSTPARANQERPLKAEEAKTADVMVKTIQDDLIISKYDPEGCGTKNTICYFRHAKGQLVSIENKVFIAAARHIFDDQNNQEYCLHKGTGTTPLIRFRYANPVSQVKNESNTDLVPVGIIENGDRIALKNSSCLGIAQNIHYHIIAPFWI